jgi:MFS superfamily sulfate permease-like transporter
MRYTLTLVIMVLLSALTLLIPRYTSVPANQAPKSFPILTCAQVVGAGTRWEVRRQGLPFTNRVEQGFNECGTQQHQYPLARFADILVAVIISLAIVQGLVRLRRREE